MTSKYEEDPSFRLNIPTESPSNLKSKMNSSYCFSIFSTLAKQFKIILKATNPFNELMIDDLTNYEMTDQRWALQRRKIGLRRRENAIRKNKVTNQREKSTIVTFISNTFTRKECVHLVKDHRRTNISGFDVCKCGALFNEHELLSSAIARNNLNSSTNNKNKWSPQNSVKDYPTNAYGKIEFINETTGSNKPAKYVRLSDQTDIKNVLTLLTDHWYLMEPYKPNLIISVIGGAKNFQLDGRKKEEFNNGLISAVKSTQAWILTAGTNVGVTRIVGEAVNEGQTIVKVWTINTQQNNVFLSRDF